MNCNVCCVETDAIGGATETEMAGGGDVGGGEVGGGEVGGGVVGGGDGGGGFVGGLEGGAVVGGSAGGLVTGAVAGAVAGVVIGAAVSGPGFFWTSTLPHPARIAAKKKSGTKSDVTFRVVEQSIQIHRQDSREMSVPEESARIGLLTYKSFDVRLHV